MTVCVVDASAAVAWVIESEASIEVDHLFERIGEEGAAVPLLWYSETLNALLVAERRGRITAERQHRYCEHFELLALTVDHDAPRLFWREIIELARRRRLTIYDATYLELAIRLGLPLATLDRDLAAAAAREGVPLLLA